MARPNHTRSPRFARLYCAMASPKARKRSPVMTIDQRYEIVIYWSDPDRAFVAEVPQLPGCAGDGPTQREALTAVRRAIKTWIATAREIGREIPKPQRHVLRA